MSMMLNLVARLVQQGRKYRQLGLNREASHWWSQLTRLNGIDRELAQEANTSLAEIHLDEGRFARARRNITAALTHQPNHAPCHFLLASAIEGEERGDRERALDHYRQAVKLDPGQADYWCALGGLADHLGEKQEAVEALRRAAELAPDDPDILLQVADGLMEDHPEEARQLLRSAMFRHPQDLRFQKLWNDFQFMVLAAEQERGRQSRQVPEEPAVLPFLRPASDPTREEGGVRHHLPSSPNRPHLQLVRTGQKHA